MKDLTQIFELIPQRLPMVMVDEHLFTNENKTQTRFSVVSDSFFCEDIGSWNFRKHGSIGCCTIRLFL